MRVPNSRGLRLACGVVSALTVVMVGVAFTTHGQGHVRMSMPHDWSHHHLVFTPPSSIAQAWKLQQEPRFWHQLLRRNASARQQGNAADFAAGRGGHGNNRKNLEHPDWGMSLLAGGTAGAGTYPAKFTFDINATPDCANDYVAFTTSLAGSTSQPSIIAFDELYSTQGSTGGLCSQNGPSVKWAYNTGPGKILTSPALSADGTKVAYVETSVTAHAILHILKWKPGAAATVQGMLTAPATPDTTLAANANWTTCPAANSCIANITFNGSPQDTGSSPFIDYANDVLYVGDDLGSVHKFTGVFNGAPAEQTTGGWPAAASAANPLTSPVFDAASSKVFVASRGGILSSISSTGTVVASARLPHGNGFVDAPLVDSSAGMIYIFAACDNAPCNANSGVWQFSTSFVASASGTETTIGTGSTGGTVFAGTFDNIYFTSANSASPTGNLYVCGNAAGNATLYRIPITANAMGTASAMATAMSTLSTTCSPVTEILNGSTDWIFVSVQSSPNVLPAIGCPALGGGCIMSFNVTAGTTPTATAARAAASGGTSGIVVDNLSASSQASSLYFTYLSNGVIGATCNGVTGVGCAIKLTQSGLQ